jgi:mRNA interferase MazF
VKKEIEQKDRIPVRQGSVWFCNFGLNIGYEIDGKDQNFLRPALVLKSFERGGGVVIPLTSVQKQNKYLIPINEISFVNITQIRYLDSRRFYRFIYTLEENKFKEIITQVKKLF